jgi:hypothetical protein
MRKKEWNDKNREKIRKQSRDNYRKNSEKYKERTAKYRKENSDKVRFWNANRKSRVKKATPKWLTKEHKAEILNFYIKAKELEEKTGKKHHVDHVYPLQGLYCSGLHVPWNLQILTAEDNLKKSNKIEGDGYEQ